MAKSKASKTETVTHTLEFKKKRVTFCIVGTTPIILNAMSSKAKQQLLFPRKKNAAEKTQSLKHDPLSEYQHSVYRSRQPNANTRLVFPAVGFKKALASAAKDIPGAAKAQIGRLTWVVGDYVELYGIPQMKMDVVRSADMNRTPDIRTRAILPEWACKVVIEFASPAIEDKTVSQLLAAAGIIMGVGDYRQEKGAGNYGTFSLEDADHPTFKRLLKSSTVKAQDEALANPEMYDSETDEMFNWFLAEREKRKGEITKAKKKSNEKESVEKEEEELV